MYLETVPEEASLWRGECFVFDERVAIGHGLKRGTHELCPACRQPLSRQDLASPLYEAGVKLRRMSFVAKRRAACIVSGTPPSADAGRSRRPSPCRSGRRRA